MLSITKPQIKRIHHLLPPVIKNDRLQKKMVISRFTNDLKKTSVKDLSFDQANKVISKYGGKPLQYENWGYFDAKNTQHRYILSLLIQLQWSYYDRQKEKTVPDIYKLSEWLKTAKKCPVRKPLKKMTTGEVSKVIHVLEKLIEWKYR